MQKITFTLLVFLISFSTFANNENTPNEIIKTGVSFGTILAIVISWSRNKNILFAIIHGFFSWLYVIYYGLFLPRRD